MGTINLFNPKGVLGSNHQFHSVKAVCSCTDTHPGASLVLGADSLVRVGFSPVSICLSLAKELVKRFRGLPFNRAPATLLTLLQRKDEICGFKKVDHTCIKPNAFMWSPRPSFSTVPACDSCEVIPAINHSWSKTLTVASFCHLGMVFLHVLLLSSLRQELLQYDMHDFAFHF